MTDPTPVVQAPDEGPWPIWPTDTLIARIDALNDTSTLAEVWAARQWPSLRSTPLLDSPTFHAIEREVMHLEDYCTPEEARQIHGWLLRLRALPDHIKGPAFEQILVLAGTTADGLADMVAMANTSPGLVTTTGRLKVIHQIVAQAIGAETDPSPVDRQADVDAEKVEEIQAGAYPGSKADIPTIKTWIGDDPNHMARAYAQELDRSTPRKRLVKWLEDGLGEKRLAQVRQAMAGSAAPPLQLASPPAPTTPVVEEEATPPAPDGPPSVGDAKEGGEARVGPDAVQPASEEQVTAPALDPPDIDPRLEGFDPVTDELAEALANAGHFLIHAARLIRKEAVA